MLDSIPLLCVESATGNNDNMESNELGDGQHQRHVGNMHRQACLAVASHGPLVAQAPGMPCMVPERMYKDSGPRVHPVMLYTNAGKYVLDAIYMRVMLYIGAWCYT